MRTGTALIETRKLKVGIAAELEDEFWEKYTVSSCVYSQIWNR
jgi:hypothetical protein